MKLLVIGGGGYYGGFVVEALRRLDGVERLDVADDQRGTTAGVAAAVVCLRDGPPPGPGVHSAPTAFGARALLDALARSSD